MSKWALDWFGVLPSCIGLLVKYKVFDPLRASRLGETLPRTPNPVFCNTKLTSGRLPVSTDVFWTVSLFKWWCSFCVQLRFPPLRIQSVRYLLFWASWIHVRLTLAVYVDAEHLKKPPKTDPFSVLFGGCRCCISCWFVSAYCLFLLFLFPRMWTLCLWFEFATK